MRTKLKDPTKPNPKKKNANGTPYQLLDEFHFHRGMPLTKMLKLNNKPRKKKLKGKDVFEGGTNKKLDPICRPAPLQRQQVRAYQHYD